MGTQRWWWTVVAVVVVAAGVVGLGLAVMVDPGFVVGFAPSWIDDDTVPARTLQAFGALLVLVPVGAAVLARRRGSHRVAGFFVVLALIAVLPAMVAVNRGADEARRLQETGAEPCAEFSGGENRCPGG